MWAKLPNCIHKCFADPLVAVTHAVFDIYIEVANQLFLESELYVASPTKKQFYLVTLQQSLMGKCCGF